MNLHDSSNTLQEKIKTFATEAVESRQVGRRLRDLLPTRYFSIRRIHASAGHNGARAERAALTDQQYLRFLDEFLHISAAATVARIQYETHLMLFQARQSLRAFNKR